MNKCKLNKCLALDIYNNYCKFYECSIAELKDYEKKQCQCGKDYIEELIDNYFESKETWD